MKKKITSFILAITLMITMFAQTTWAETVSIDEATTCVANQKEKASKSVVSSEKKRKFVAKVENAIEKSSSLDGDDYEIQSINAFPENISTKDVIVCNSVEEVVKYLETQEKQMEVTNSQKIEYVANSLLGASKSKNTSKSKTKTVTKSYSRGLTPKYTLKADFTYNTSTKKITAVKNRKFTATGITVTAGVADKSYSTTYSKSHKTATVKCTYTAISYLVTPIGKMEVSRHNAYQKFSYSVSGGVTNGKGGYE